MAAKDLIPPGALKCRSLQIKAKLMNSRHVERNEAYYHLSADQGRIFRKVTESLGAAAALVMGLQFILVGFESFTWPYLPLLVFVPAPVWGAIMLGLGSVRAVILAVNGWWPLSHSARKIMSLLFIAFVWLPLTACFWWGLVIDLGHGEFKTYPGLAYSMYALGIEFMVFYAHSTYVYAVKWREQDE